MDLSFVLDQVTAEFPSSPLFLAGVSLGGNVLLKFLGERGRLLQDQVLAAAAVSVPYDLARSSRYIDEGFSRVYQARFLKSLHRKAALKHAAFPAAVPDPARSGARTLYAFDDAFTAPVHGFVDADDYYARSSAIRWLASIRTPTLLLSAVDDPFLPAEVLSEVRAIAVTNPALVPEFVDRGGHVGFVSGRFPWRPFYYAEWRISEFFFEALRGRTDSASSSAVRI
jgi:predicted alpha/beta-fold hydrolase